MIKKKKVLLVEGVPEFRESLESIPEKEKFMLIERWKREMQEGSNWTC
jgi:hypothetical protein